MMAYWTLTTVNVLSIVFWLVLSRRLVRAREELGMKRAELGEVITLLKGVVEKYKGPSALRDLSLVKRAQRLHG